MHFPLFLRALSLGLALAASAQTPVLSPVEYLAGNDVLILGFDSTTNSYYRVESDPSSSTGVFDRVVGMVLGTGSALSYPLPLAGATNGWFRLREVPVSAPLDTDGDTLNDVFELTYPTCMNALVADDPSANCDGDGRTNFEEQGDGTDPTQPDGPTSGGLVINEIDYDQTGTDTNEFIEIYNSSSAAISLDNLAVVLVNGTTSSNYNPRILLSGSLPAGGFLVLASANVQVASGAQVIRMVSNNAGTPNQDIIQNGAPDAVTLVDLARGVVVDSLSYEGSITAAIINGLPGTHNLVEGTATPLADSGAPALSLARLPDGADTHDDSVDWISSFVPTPGAANVEF